MDNVITFLFALGGIAFAVAVLAAIFGAAAPEKPGDDPIRSVDWPAIRARLERQLGWEPGRAEAALRQYREFLALARENRGAVFAPLSADMELAWREHVLDTRAYAADCESVFGETLHYAPSAARDAGWRRVAEGNTALYLARRAEMKPRDARAAVRRDLERGGGGDGGAVFFDSCCGGGDGGGDGGGGDGGGGGD